MTGKGGEIQGKLNLVRVSGELELTGFCCIQTTEQIFNFHWSYLVFWTCANLIRNDLNKVGLTPLSTLSISPKELLTMSPRKVAPSLFVKVMTSGTCLNSPFFLKTWGVSWRKFLSTTGAQSTKFDWLCGSLHVWRCFAAHTRNHCRMVTGTTIQFLCKLFSETEDERRWLNRKGT